MNHDDPIESVYDGFCGTPLHFGGMYREQNRSAVAGGLGVWGAIHIPSVAISINGPHAHLCFASPWLQVCCVASCRYPLCMSRLAGAIRHRAAEVRRPYEFIGIFDFVAFALHHKVEVFMLFGSYVVDLLQTFTSSWKPSSADWPKARVAAVVGVSNWQSAVGPDGTLQALLPAVSHYVIGLAVDHGAPTPFAACPSSSAVRAAMRANWVLRPTATQGDCGIDALCYHLGRPRTRASWQAIRTDIADFMDKIADDPVWQDVFVATQEYVRKAAAPAVGCLGPPVGSVAASASSCGSSTAASVPSCALQLVASPPSGTSPPEALPAALLAPAPPPLPPPPFPCDDAEGGALVKEAVAPVNVGGDSAFVAWIRSMSAAELLQVTQSAATFRDAEAAAFPPRKDASGPIVKKLVIKTKGTSLVTYRVALGHAFLRWRAAEGHDSKAFYKDTDGQYQRKIGRRKRTYVRRYVRKVSPTLWWQAPARQVVT